ncbi:MAG: SHOCT domain-containing protein [Ignavibacteriales bacterium]|nr:SHOCT domain-containing protein [Ignavibacteriales bacterium]
MMGLIVAVAMLIFGVFFFNAVLSDSGGERRAGRRLHGPLVPRSGRHHLLLRASISGPARASSRSRPRPAPARTGPRRRSRPGGLRRPAAAKLEGLKKDGLVTDEEYRAKRAEILGEKW